MNVGSLFSGIGGLDLGLHRAGMRHVFFCESDPWRRSVLAHHWPGIPIYEDVVRVRESACGSAVDGLCEATDGGGREAGAGLPVDLLCGGFPCQDVSVAGRRAGLDGKRSGLFFEFARVIELVQPRWLLIENVPGLLSSHQGRDFARIIDTLDELGYVGAWRILNSQFFGVPQRRRRVFILAADAGFDLGGERCAEILAVGTRCERHPATRGKARQEVAAPLGGSVGERRGHDGNPFDRGGALVKASYATQDTIRQTVRRLTPTECERLQGLPDDWTALGADSRRYGALGDAVTVNVAEWIGRRLMDAS